MKLSALILLLVVVVASNLACGTAFAPRNRTPHFVTPTAVLQRSPSIEPAALPNVAPAASPTTPPVTPTVQVTPTLSAEKRVVGNTGDSRGANLRQTPDGPVISTYAEGTVMTLLGPQQQVDGRLWMQVQAPNGATGWMLAIVLLVSR